MTVAQKFREISVYQYLDAVLPYFWHEVFVSSDFDVEGYVGLSDMHGDKCDQYFEDWEAAGIYGNRGALLYMLTYTTLLGKTPKHESCQWVIDNYKTYERAILRCENRAVDEHGFVLIFDSRLRVVERVSL